MIRVYAVLAHDNKDSLNAFLFNSIVLHLKNNGIEVDILDLYSRAQEIPFYLHDRAKLEQNSFYQENKERFMAADRLLFIYPVYWYSVPGILKTWQDLITNFAWSYRGGPYAKPIHKIQRTFTVNSSTAPVWWRRFMTGNIANRQVKEFCKWIGIFKNGFYSIGSVEKLDKNQVQKHLEKILAQSEKFLL